MTVEQRITDYLSSGGLFNPEMMEHDKVCDLLIEARDLLEQLRKEREELRAKCETIGKMLGHAGGICLEDRVANLRGNHGTLFGIAKGLLLRAAHDATCNGNYECTCSLKEISEVLTDIHAALHPTGKPA